MLMSIKRKFSFCTKKRNVEEKSLNQPKENNAYLYFVMIGANITILNCYIGSSWPSPALAKLADESSHIHISDDEGSWIVNAFVAGGLAAPFLILFIMDTFSRTMALFITGMIPLIIGWILTGLADSVEFIYVARVVLGLGSGCCHCIMPHYLSEIATENSRAIMSATMIVMAKLGSLFTFSIGPYVPLRTFSWIALGTVLFASAILIVLPASPYHLLSKNKEELAAKSLKKLRRRSDVKTELEDMKKTIEISRRQAQGSWKEFIAPNNRRRFLLVILLSVAQQASGIMVITAYAETIFMEVGGSINSSEASILFGVALLISSIISMWVMEKFGRRILLMTSMGGVIVCVAAVGFFFLASRYVDDVQNFTWIPIIAMIAYTFFYCLGIASVPYVFLGEVFPKHLKPLASTILAVNGALCAMIVVKCFQIISTNFGREYSFLGLAAICSIFMPLFYFLVPETKGKTLLLILEEMNMETTYL